MDDRFWSWFYGGMQPPKRRQERLDVAALAAWEIESLERLYKMASPTPPALPLGVIAGVRAGTPAEVVEQDRAMLRQWIEQYRANRRYKG